MNITPEFLTQTARIASDLDERVGVISSHIRDSDLLAKYLDVIKEADAKAAEACGVTPRVYTFFDSPVPSTDLDDYDSAEPQIEYGDIHLRGTDTSRDLFSCSLPLGFLCDETRPWTEQAVYAAALEEAEARAASARDKAVADAQSKMNSFTALARELGIDVSAVLPF